MADLLKVQLRGGPKLIEALRTKPLKIVNVLTGRVTRLMFMLSSFIVSKKLSGQVLHRRTGKLAGSVRAFPASIQGTKIVGHVEAGGGAAFYAATHEFGGSRAYQIMAVKARALRFISNGKTVFAKSVIHPPAKIRAFMKPSLLENADSMRAELQAALDEAIKE